MPVFLRAALVGAALSLVSSCAPLNQQQKLQVLHLVDDAAKLGCVLAHANLSVEAIEVLCQLEQAMWPDVEKVLAGVAAARRIEADAGAR